MRKRVAAQKIIFQIFTVAVLGISWTNLYGQKFSSPFIRNYSPKEYKQHTQNWSLVQDDQGIMYIGNNNGVIQYDGNNWELIVADGIVRSMVMDSKGVIYIGTQANFGKLVVDSTGNKVYQSIYNRYKDQIDPTDSIEFGDIWNVHVLNGKVYYQANEVLFEWDPVAEKLAYWKANIGYGRFHVSFCVNDEIFIKYIRGGLYHLVDGQLEPATNSAIFSDYHVFSMLPYKPDTILLGTYRHAIQKYVLSTGELISLPSEADAFFKENGIYNGFQISDQRYFFGTLNGGGVIVDNVGNVIQYITSRQGLQSSKIKQSLVDHDGNLWLALNYGVSMIELNNPWTRWGVDHGLDTKIYSTLVDGEDFWVGTPVGAYTKKIWEEEFTVIPEIKGQTWDWVKYYNEDSSRSGLLVANQSWIGSWENGKLDIIEPALQVYFIEPSKVYNNRYYFGMTNGIGAVEYENGTWKYLGRHKSLDAEVRGLYETNYGDLWLSTGYSGIWKLSLPQNGDFTNAVLHPYDTLSGLISMRQTDMFYEGEQLYFGQPGGVFTFDSIKNKFIRNFTFHQYIAEADTNQGLKNFKKDQKQNIWMKLMDRKEEEIHYLMLRSVDSTDVPYSSDLKSFKRVDFGEVVDLKPGVIEGQPYMFISSSEGLFVYDFGNEYRRNYEPEILIRSIIEMKGDTLYRGQVRAEDDSTELKDWFVLPFDRNSIAFTFSSPSYIREDKTEFSYYLEGFDQEGEWSAWSTVKHKEYTNLDPNGHYRFFVKARNVFGEESEPAICTFTVLSPWYLEWYALVLYVVMAILMVYGLIKFNTARLKHKNRLLEKIVSERTQEIQMKNQELEQYNEEIMAQRDQIESQKLQVEEANEELNQINEEILAQRDQIESQNKVLIKQNEDILASISYASKIQRAILPPASNIRKYLPDSFFLYMPKDIVSGDFYWMEQVGHKVLWAAVDCTGHGVPGAFMSILGANGLKQIVLERGILKPAEILEQLTQHVINSMGDSDEGKDIMDGMDIALCCWDQKTGTLEYSGAYNPLYVVRQDELIEIKATRRPVGRHLAKKKKTFENHVVELQEGDLIYVFSDGFADQFGGKDGEKYTYKRLRNTILELRNQPMKDQGEELTDIFNKWRWRRAEPQLDDVCVIGVQIKQPIRSN